MAMKLVKKTDEYSIYQRGDNRYAVKDANKQPVNAEEKVRILVEAELLKVAVPLKPEAPAADEADAEDAQRERDRREADFQARVAATIATDGECRSAEESTSSEVATL